ncbi:hypothetical protein KAFR_0D01380 [Kazachstania africana CBS 2517]|uniref:BZIP domain-containing protein n=1 Tax=Kazachstania africana (strain ATCC 22294 / BCRC 22015 / CBS 2517 / CECT 1963 / NBRC 1671 / NRRL Y-8276) TaxID=1071382 RepID=H2ATT4_KAZAF|nr:hypothetical protein KAFR_0D01380 [Kazachstania africana CBS 2517]CCF57784.1 hypothetical protein KAFR_0D01380 [Kazachstania africana CBS 2517]
MISGDNLKDLSVNNKNIIHMSRDLNQLSSTSSRTTGSAARSKLPNQTLPLPESSLHSLSKINMNELDRSRGLSSTLAHGNKYKNGSASDATTDSNENSDSNSPTHSIPLNNGSKKVDSTARRRKQNREAQRAYRERKANRIQSLENTVNMLRESVDSWQLKYNLLERDYNETKILLDHSLRTISTLKAEKQARIGSPITNGTPVPYRDGPFTDLTNDHNDNHVRRTHAVTKNTAHTGTTPETHHLNSISTAVSETRKEDFRLEAESKLTVLNEPLNRSENCMPLENPKENSPSVGSGRSPHTKMCTSIDDTYQRIRKHMHFAGSPERKTSVKKSLLISMLEKISSDMQVKDNAVEISSFQNLQNGAGTENNSSR